MITPDRLLKAISQAFNTTSASSPPLSINSAVSGGSINSCYKLLQGNKKYFIKVNDLASYPRMFSKEAEGLNLIRSTGTIKTPEVLLEGAESGYQFLILEWVESGPNTTKAQEALGSSLAAMHRNKNQKFGLDHWNYMGSLRQSNRYHDNQADFFINERLLPQIEIANDKKLLDKTVNSDFEVLFNRLKNLLPPEEASLVHGDLWSGNYMIDTTDNAVLIDPAVSYSHREVDLAMSTLFGGFSPVFYEAYHSVYPLEKGWLERTSLWNLYPLLIHLNLFGTSYIAKLKQSLRPFL